MTPVFDVLLPLRSRRACSHSRICRAAELKLRRVKLAMTRKAVYSSRIMKPVLLLFFVGIILWQNGCAQGPTLDERSRQDQREVQTLKQSDAFARSLSQ